MSRLKSRISMMILLVFAGVTLQLPAQAAMMTTQDLVAQAELQTERDRLQERLLRDDVKTELLSLGVSPEDVEARIAGMTAGEIASINGKLDTLPAGGDGLGTVAVVLLILILLEITGAIDIFPRI